jgi:hypothetical protein
MASGTVLPLVFSERKHPVHSERAAARVEREHKSTKSGVLRWWRGAAGFFCNLIVLLSKQSAISILQPQRVHNK